MSEHLAEGKEDECSDEKNTMVRILHDWSKRRLLFNGVNRISRDEKRVLLPPGGQNRHQKMMNVDVWTGTLKLSGEFLFSFLVIGTFPWAVSQQTSVKPVWIRR